MPQQVSLQEFAQKIRERRPDLAGIPDVTLVAKTLQAAPELKPFVDIGNLPGMDAVAKAMPDDRSAGMVASDQAANVLKGLPQAVTAIPGIVETLAKGMTGNPRQTVRDILDMVKGGAQPVGTVIKGAVSGRTIPLPGLTGAVQFPEYPEGNPASPAWAQAAQGAGANLAGVELPNAVAGALRGAGVLIPSEARAQAKFEQVAQKAGNVPTNQAATDAIAARYNELTQRGHSKIKVFEDLMTRRENPEPIPYNESRDFAIKAGELSAAEKQMASGQMKAQVSKLADALKTANREAAETVGMEKVYDQAIKEYRQAKGLQEKVAIVKKHWFKAAATGALGYGAYGLYRELQNQ